MKLDWKLLLCGLMLCFNEVLLAEIDQYCRQKQLQDRGIKNAYSLFEHGGWWLDVTVFTPLIACLVGSYQFAYEAWWSYLIAVFAITATVGIGYFYSAIGPKKMPTVILPDSFVHNGRTTPAGYIHLLFMACGIYLTAMFYFTPLQPAPSRIAICATSGLLSLFFFFVIKKFTKRWEFSSFAKKQLAGELLVLWTVTALKIFYRF